jgi:MFS family permease
MPFGGEAGDMSVTTGSLGTTDVSASSPSLHGLDGINFFLAAVLAGFGPYVPAYLVDQKWTQTEIGLVLTAGSVAGLLSQLPGGELLDKVRSKRAVIAIAVCIVILSALFLHSGRAYRRFSSHWCYRARLAAFLDRRSLRLALVWLGMRR